MHTTSQRTPPPPPPNGNAQVSMDQRVAAAAPATNDSSSSSGVGGGGTKLGDGPLWMRRPVWLALVAAMRINEKKDERLRQVLDGLLRELNGGEIAHALGLQESAVKTCFRQLRARCHCRSLMGVLIAIVRMTTSPATAPTHGPRAEIRRLAP